ncbi:hypothetical protein ACVWZR_002403 [Bradyrhizobium sp. i1.3.1]
MRAIGNDHSVHRWNVLHSAANKAGAKRAIAIAAAKLMCTDQIIRLALAKNPLNGATIGFIEDMRHLGRQIAAHVQNVAWAER